MKSDIAGIGTVFLGVFSLLLALIANFWCQYASTTLTLTSAALGNSTSYPLYHGIWNYRYTNTIFYSTNGEAYAYSYYSCSKYGDYIPMDTKWNSAKAFTIVAVCLGGIGMFLSCAALGISKFWKPVSMLFFLATLFQALTFLYFQSSGCGGKPPVDYGGTTSDAISVSLSDGCGLASAAKIGIAATCMWFVAALTALASGKQE